MPCCALTALPRLTLAGGYVTLLTLVPSMLDQSEHSRYWISWQARVPVWLLLGAAVGVMVTGVFSYRLRRAPRAPRV